MRHSIKLGVLALLASTALLASRADAASIPNSNGIRDAADALSVIDHVQVYVYGGRRYCWDEDGWEGAGWDWGNYAWGRRLCWGGGYGWQNWRWNGRSRYWRGGVYIRGGGGGGRTVVRPGRGGTTVVRAGRGGRTSGSRWRR